MAERSAILFPAGMAPLTLGNYIKLGTNLSGRDKLMRLVQYGSKAAIFHLGEKSESGAKLQALQKALGLHRKAFKLGMFLDEAQKFIEALTAPKLEDLDRLLTLVQRLAMTLFVIYDNILYLTEIKVTSAFDKASVKMKSYQFRFIAAVCSLIQVVLAVSKQQDVVDGLAAGGAKTPEATEKLTKAREKQGLNVWKLTKNGMDFLTYANSAEVLKAFVGKSFDDGTAGVVGAISSYAGLVEIVRCVWGGFLFLVGVGLTRAATVANQGQGRLMVSVVGVAARLAFSSSTSTSTARFVCVDPFRARLAVGLSLRVSAACHRHIDPHARTHALHAWTHLGVGFRAAARLGLGVLLLLLLPCSPARLLACPRASRRTAVPQQQGRRGASRAPSTPWTR